MSAERPRDELGRPLPWEDTGFPGVPPRDDISAEEATAHALDYLQRGLPFHAHEVLEQRWRCCPEVERALWRALAQAAAGVTHAARGNAEGARRLHARAISGLQEYAGPRPDDLIAALGLSLD